MFAVVFAVLTIVSTPADTSTTSHFAATKIGQVTVLDTTLARVIAEMATRSPYFAAGLDSLAHGPVSVLVGNVEQISSQIPEPARPATHHLAYTHIRADKLMAAARANPKIRVPITDILVAVNVAQLAQAAEEAGDPALRDHDIAIALAHELIGHALPWSQSNHYFQGCADPSFEQLQATPNVTGCAVDRENAVRGELGIARRTSYAANPFQAGNPDVVRTRREADNPRRRLNFVRSR